MPISGGMVKLRLGDSVSVIVKNPILERIGKALP